MGAKRNEISVFANFTIQSISGGAACNCLREHMVLNDNAVLKIELYQQKYQHVLT